MATYLGPTLDPLFGEYRKNHVILVLVRNNKLQLPSFVKFYEAVLEHTFNHDFHKCLHTH